MSPSVPNARRLFLKTSLAAAGLAAVAPRALAATLGDGAIVEAAKAGLARAGSRVGRRDLVGVADFRQPSSRARLHLVDLANGRVDSLLVAHGRGSDPDHTGWLRRFSNAPGSDATSEGDYVTGEYYVGAHGRSMRLEGLDPTNCNAQSRGIVVHAAWYVSPQMVREHGMLGRSEGCFAVSQADLPNVLARLGPGRLLTAAKL